jgi:class 3 adenylate cyclase
MLAAMAGPIAFLSRCWRALRRLHLGLYFLFLLMIGLGGIVATLFEQYSIADLKSGLVEAQRRVEAEERGERASPGASARLRDAFKPLHNEKRHITYDVRDKKGQTPQEQGGWAVLFIVVWLWPLYRYYFSSKPPNLLRVERRIIDWPVFLFGLTWLVAAQHYLARMASYRERYGEPDLHILAIFAAGAFMFGAFTGYLNLELTQLYVRRFIARPFFRAHNPFGLKRGVRLGLTARYVLLLFSLATVPVALFVYIPVNFNWDLIASLASEKGSAIFFDNAGVLVPLVMTTVIAVVMLIFHALSILLYRLNVQRPIVSLIDRMRTVASGDLDCKTAVLDSDEVGQLKGHFNLMLDGLHERERIKDTFGRYVSVEIAEKIIKSGSVNLAGEEIEATVLFSDIRGFTSLSESLSPAEVVRFLNSYLAHVTPPIMASGGVINKFIGDAVMAIFSPVFGLEHHVDSAVRAALGMREALAKFNQAGEFPTVTVGIGMHTGRLVAGNVGTTERREYTVLGDVVNVASRIENETKEKGTDILLSGDVLAGLNQAQFAGVHFDYCGPVLLRGKSNAIELYRLVHSPVES